MDTVARMDMAVSRSRLLVVALALGAALVLPASAGAAAWGVSSTTDTPVGQACPGFTGCSLRQAVTSTEANPGPDAILISAGTYPLTNGPLSVSQDLSVARVGASATTISAGGLSRIFDVSGAGTDFVVRFVTLTSGSANGNGGAMRTASGTTLSVESSTISNSNATGTTDARGGAIYAQGNVTIGVASGSTTGSTISANTASASGAGATVFGGGVAVEGATLTIGARSTISNNGVNGPDATSVARGGGVYVAGPASITQATVSGNQAQGGSAIGGGVAADNGAVTFVGSTVNANTATSTGAGTTGGGGGVALTTSGNADLAVQFSTLSGNTASTTSAAAANARGGAILTQAAASAVDATNSTIASNTASAPLGSSAGGGGVFAAGPVNIGATILAENTPAAQCDGGALTSSGYSVLGNLGSCSYAGGTADVTGVSDAGLGGLTANGGLTQTLMPELGSPTLDLVAAAATLCTATPTDQRGVTRPQNGNCDAGAVEARPATLSISPDPRSFPTTAVGQTSTANVAVSNTGDLAMSAAPSASTSAPFSYTGGCTSAVAAGSNCIMTLTFAPTAAGAASQTLTVTSGALSDTATLDGTGVAPVAQVTPGTGHDFGSQLRGTQSADFDYTLSNTGDATLNITSIALSGGDAGAFATTSICGATLAAGADCTIHTRFTPADAGARTTDLAVTTDGGDATRRLNGTGTAPVSAPPTTTTTTAPQPTAPAAPPLPLRCSGREITILDLRVSGKRVTLRGLALTRHAGQTVTITVGAKRLGTATVGTDGAFSATVKLPAGKGRVRFAASVDGKTSARFSLERRFVILRRRLVGSRVVIDARVIGARRGSRATIRRSTSCTKRTTIATVRVGAGGRITMTLPLPSAAEGVAIFTATSRVGGGRTFTLPIAVTPSG